MLAALLASASAGMSTASAAAESKITLVRAAVASEATNDSRQAMAPAAGQAFLWVTVKAEETQTIDLTKVAVGAGATSLP
ncbi:MAG TPA: hypothetical protein VL691_05390, partial [Vicinamibacteria bacterium]|nr:hypothetical protein [Vicinamibacteria bacterium]